MGPGLNPCRVRQRQMPSRCRRIIRAERLKSFGDYPRLRRLVAALAKHVAQGRVEPESVEEPAVA